MGCTASVSFVGAKCICLKPNQPVIQKQSVGIGTTEKAIIKRQWKVLSADIRGNGTAVFLQLFKQNPELKKLFSFRHIDDTELWHDVEFKRHGIRFMQAINATVENIDDLETSMSGTLEDLGRQHVSFTGFKPTFFEAFHDAIISVWKEVLGTRFTPACEAAWSHLLAYIMETLKRGHCLASIEVKVKGKYQDSKIS